MALSQSYGTGGSTNSASNWSRNSATTYAEPANNSAQNAASLAYNRQLAINRETMAFNAEEAQKQREWEENMANTIYTRSVKNMKEAGINPILAANMGLSAASVGSGATASFGGSSTPMSQTFMDSVSSGMSAGSSYGESWQNSQAGMLTFAEGVKDMFQGIIGQINSAEATEQATEQATEALGELEKSNSKNESDLELGGKYYPNWERFKRKLGNISESLKGLAELAPIFSIPSGALAPIGKNNKSKNTYSA